MLKLEQLQKMWEEDSKIDKLKLDDESLNVQKLHAKYAVHYAHVRLALRQAEKQYYKMRSLRTAYYRGELSKEELQQLEWPQWLKNKPLKSELEDLLMCDEKVMLAADKYELIKTLATLLEQIIKAINGRSYDIRNAIEWTKWTNGLI